VPARLKFVDDFPRTSAGKVRKQELRRTLVVRLPWYLGLLFFGRPTRPHHIAAGPGGRDRVTNTSTSSSRSRERRRVRPPLRWHWSSPTELRRPEFRHGLRWRCTAPTPRLPPSGTAAQSDPSVRVDRSISWRPSASSRHSSSRSPWRRWSASCSISPCFAGCARRARREGRCVSRRDGRADRPHRGAGRQQPDVGCAGSSRARRSRSATIPRRGRSAVVRGHDRGGCVSAGRAYRFTPFDWRQSRVRDRGRRAREWRSPERVGRYQLGHQRGGRWFGGVLIAPLTHWLPGTYTLFIVPALAAAVLAVLR